MNQTEQLLELARDDIDRRLINFGYNPWQVDAFRALTPSQRLQQISSFNQWVARVRKLNAHRRQ